MRCSQCPLCSNIITMLTTWWLYTSLTCSLLYISITAPVLTGAHGAFAVKWTLWTCQFWLNHHVTLWCKHILITLSTFPSWKAFCVWIYSLKQWSCRTTCLLFVKNNTVYTCVWCVSMYVVEEIVLKFRFPASLGMWRCSIGLIHLNHGLGYDLHVLSRRTCSSRTMGCRGMMMFCPC